MAVVASGTRELPEHQWIYARYSLQVQERAAFRIEKILETVVRLLTGF